MAKKILVMVEYGEDNTYSCYSETAIGDYALIDGDGNTVAEAKADFLRAVEECREIYPDDKRYSELSFEYKYDLRSFFNYFRYCPKKVCKLQSSYICSELKNQRKNNEAYK